MARTVVRQMKKALRAGTFGQVSMEARANAAQAALALLDRSVRLRHERLALLRLKAAVSMGLTVPDEIWVYCRDIAAKSHDARLKDVYLAAAHNVKNVRCGGMKGVKHG